MRLSFLFCAPFLSLPAMAAEPVERFRDMGPKGVEAAIAAKVPDAILDQVCKQHDCRASKLYWHTDFQRALQASRTEKKPVLSLRLLGKLDEELSCANSRFFRTLLYSDPSIASLLREKFILHWQSERPAPKITIDFGDGRKMVQTVTGNSIHYLLDSGGLVLDALPGLYSPEGFRAALVEFRELFDQVASLQGTARQEKLAAYHRSAAKQLDRSWAGGKKLPPVESYSGSTGRVPASDAARMAMSKAVVEIRPIQAIQPDSTERKRLRELMDDPVWARMGKEHSGKVRFSPESDALVRSKLVYDPATGLQRSGDETRRALEALKTSVAIDGVRNDYIYRRVLHAWLVKESYALEDLNARVYESLFLTPGTDPWLGLKPEGVYTGIRGDGITVAGP